MLPAAWSGSVASFLALAPKGILDDRSVALAALLHDAFLRAAIPREGWVVLDWRLLRRATRIDAVIATGGAIVVVQYRPGAVCFTQTDRRAAEDAALDLADFHAGSRDRPILPIVLIPNGARPRPQLPLPLPGAAAPIEATRLTLPGLLEQVARLPRIPFDGPAWADAPYAPVAGLLDAAGMLYANHGVSRLRLAAAGPEALRRTQAALAAAIARAQRREEKSVVFVTGAPGAGKTLIALDLAFARGAHAAFLTGNPTLVHVLRESLVRDAPTDRRAAQRRMAAIIQSLPAFRDHHVATAAPPAESLLVLDEAQRCWSSEHAVRKTRNRLIPLTDSEPGHLLDILSRRPGAAVLVCLLGGGQEIHDGEGGLAAWGDALRCRPHWSILAPPDRSDDPRQRLPALPNLQIHADLHLGTPVRAIGAPGVAAWVDAVLANDPARAAAIARAAGTLPFSLTRSLSAMRTALHPAGVGAGTRTAGLLASSTARRLRAEGLGAVLPHQDEGAVASWFLERWPDIRSADALEVVATEFAVQGLELDRVGVCWDADLIRGPEGWLARRFRANAWTRASSEASANRRNAYRVLLTRARSATILWIPVGDRRDLTRDPAHYDAVATYLLACGARPLDAERACADDPPVPEPSLL